MLPHVFIAMRERATKKKANTFEFLTIDVFFPSFLSIKCTEKNSRAEQFGIHSFENYCAKSQITKRNDFMSFGILGAVSIMTRGLFLSLYLSLHLYENNKSQFSQWKNEKKTESAECDDQLFDIDGRLKML